MLMKCTTGRNLKKKFCVLENAFTFAFVQGSDAVRKKT